MVTYPIVIAGGRWSAGVNGPLLRVEIHVQTRGYNVWDNWEVLYNTSRLRCRSCGAHNAVQFYARGFEVMVFRENLKEIVQLGTWECIFDIIMWWIIFKHIEHFIYSHFRSWALTRRISYALIRKNIFSGPFSLLWRLFSIWRALLLFYWGGGLVSPFGGHFSTWYVGFSLLMWINF